MRSQIMDGGAARRRQGRRTSDREAQAIVDCLDSLPVKRQDALSHDPGR